PAQLAGASAHDGPAEPGGTGNAGPEAVARLDRPAASFQPARGLEPEPSRRPRERRSRGAGLFGAAQGVLAFRPRPPARGEHDVGANAVPPRRPRRGGRSPWWAPGVALRARALRGERRRVGAEPPAIPPGAALGAGGGGRPPAFGVPGAADPVRRPPGGAAAPGAGEAA